ncbi:MAG: HlyD family efflux transporter periplasmic adaptor subunit [Rhodobacteraceae bacterium]|nr:HlyD family efflux transporter periplasmic adaptor subunit [Paracoccaceae bacterium]
MRFLRRSLVGIVLLAVTIALIALAGDMVRGALKTRLADDPRPREARERVFAANVITVEPGVITPVLDTFGEIRGRRSLELRATSGGAVIELGAGVEEGGAVAAGDLLVRIDPVVAQAALDVARADLSEAEAEARDAARALELAEADVAAAQAQAELRKQALLRQEDLRARGVGTEAAVETSALAAASADQAVLSRRQALAAAQTRIDQAALRLDRVSIALAEARRGLAETEIFAEFDGVLSDVTVVQGGLVANNERLASLIDPAALEVAFRVSTAQYTRLLDEGRLRRAEVAVSLDVAGVDLIATGQISRENAAVGDGQTGRLLFAELAQTGGFRPGDFVTVRVEEPPLRGVAQLPASAVDAAGTVLALGAEDRLEAVEATVLRRQGDDVLVRARALAGREVVAERSPLLGAGIKIRPIREGASTEAPEAPAMVELSDERRAKLIAFVEANKRMPAEAKQRVLAQLSEPSVPARVVERIESRMGG